MVDSVLGTETGVAFLTVLMARPVGTDEFHQEKPVPRRKGEVFAVMFEPVTTTLMLGEAVTKTLALLARRLRRGTM